MNFNLIQRKDKIYSGIIADILHVILWTINPVFQYCLSYNLNKTFKVYVQNSGDGSRALKGGTSCLVYECMEVSTTLPINQVHKIYNLLMLCSMN